jgi:hypothetical protein
MSVLDYIAAVAVTWLTAATIVAAALAFAACRLKARRAARTPDRAYPPPVPPSHPRHLSLADQPVDVWLTDELSDRLFDEILALEGLQ